MADKKHSRFSRKATFWGLVPAAGVGARMGTETPKQYLRLGGRTILEHSIRRLLDLPSVEGVMVALNPNDELWSELPVFNDARVRTVQGGAERSGSVLSGLREMRSLLHPDDWVLVHDAARPCVRSADLALLVEKLSGQAVGGLLGAPVRDTIKRVSGSSSIEATLERATLWRAFTPQMFRFQLLLQALEDALQRGIPVTDESSAVEAAGHKPLIVQGHSDNIKITTPEDLLLAESVIQEIELNVAGGIA